MSSRMIGGRWVVAFGLLLAAATTSVALTSSQVKALWVRDMALIYDCPGSFNEAFWTVNVFKPLVAYVGTDGKAKDWLFDGFLFFGPQTLVTVNGNMTGTPSLHPASAADGAAALASWLRGAANLSTALQQAAKEMNKPIRTIKVVISIPYPDPRWTTQTYATLDTYGLFGPINGQYLDLYYDANRIKAAELYVDMALKQWTTAASQGKLKGLKLVGFWWPREGIFINFPDWQIYPTEGTANVPANNNDVNVVKAFVDYVHRKGYLVHWTPGYQNETKDNSYNNKYTVNGKSVYASQWMGLDCVTIQTNYQAPASDAASARPLTIFSEMDGLISQYAMQGMEWNAVVRYTELNPRCYTPYQVWLANLDAALRLNWARFSNLTYFNAGEMSVTCPSPSVLRTADQPLQRLFYDTLYKWVKRTLTNADLMPIADQLADDMATAGYLTSDRVDTIKADGTVLQKLYDMERPEAEWGPHYTP